MALLEERVPVLPAPICRVPALIVVVPVWVFAPVRMSVPAPNLVRLPLVVADVPDIVREPVKLVTLMPLVVPAVRVKLRSVELLDEPVYSKVPPPRTRLPAALVELPRAPAAPPLVIAEMLSVPPLIVVAPV